MDFDSSVDMRKTTYKMVSLPFFFFSFFLFIPSAFFSFRFCFSFFSLSFELLMLLLQLEGQVIVKKKVFPLQDCLEKD
jgi:hypothetical protein